MLLIGYSAFRNFALGKNIKDRLLAKAISDDLQVLQTLFISKSNPVVIFFQNGSVCINTLE